MPVAVNASHGRQYRSGNGFIALSRFTHGPYSTCIHLKQIAIALTILVKKYDKAQNKDEEGTDSGNINIASRIGENTSDETVGVAGIQD